MLWGLRMALREEEPAQQIDKVPGSREQINTPVLHRDAQFKVLKAMIFQISDKRLGSCVNVRIAAPFKFVRPNQSRNLL